MGVKSYLGGIWKAIKTGKQTNPAEIFYPGLITDYGLMHPDDFDGMVKADNSWVYVFSNKNANAVAKVPFRLYASKPKTRQLNFEARVLDRKERKKLAQYSTAYKIISDSQVEVVELLEHPFYDVMENVNDFTNRFELMSLTQKFLELVGNAYWYVLRDNMFGAPREIWLLPAHQVRILPDKSNFISQYLYFPDWAIEPIRFDPEEIIHFKNESTKNVFYGKSPLAGVISAVNINIMMHQYQQTVFASGGRPDLILKYARELDKKKKKEIRDNFAASVGGANRKSNLIVLSGLGKENIPELEKITWNPEEMNILGQNIACRNEIAAAFDVPITMIETTDVNRANAMAGREQFARDNTEPRIIRLQEKMQERFVPMWDERLVVLPINVVPEDEDAQLRQDLGYVKGGIWTANEVREAQGREPLEGGDELRSSSMDVNLTNDQIKELTEKLDKELKDELERRGMLDEKGYIKADMIDVA